MNYSLLIAQLWCLLFLFSVINNAAAQESKTLPAKKLVVSTSTLEYAGLNNLGVSNFNLGAEVYVGTNFSVYLNGGYLKSVFEPIQFLTSKTNSKGYALQLEGRKYLGKWKIIDPLVLAFWPHIFQYKSMEIANSGYYTSLMLHFQHIDSKNYWAGNTVTNQDLIQDNLGLSLKVGYQCIKAYGLVVDYSVGVGLKYKETNANGQSNDLFLGQNYTESGLFPTVHYQLRIGFGK